MHLTTDGVYLANSLATHTVIRPLQMPLWIDLTSVVIAALAGAAVAVEERLDLVGGILLAVIMGLGGGIIRDLLLGLRPVAVTNHYYLPTVTAAALAGYLFASLLRRFGTPFIVLDAMATSLFTVAGVEKALLYGYSASGASRTDGKAELTERAHCRHTGRYIDIRVGKARTSADPDVGPCP